ncbi:MAG: ABC transporter permease subunit [Chloroflexi bacterium]|nr:ABC transporter permease subunit [Chloroflexota bacterium]
MRTILIIANLTLREAIRRKIVLAALILGTAFLLLYGLGFHFIRQEMLSADYGRLPSTTMQNQTFNFMLLAGMYVVNFLCIAIAALITADSLAGEIQSGIIQATVTKPIRRSEVVLGKWLGNATLLLFYLSLMGGGVMLVVWLISRLYAPNWAGGLALIYFNSLLIMTLTLACSSSLSTLATGGVVFGAFGLAFLGGWVERIGTFLENRTAIDLGIFSSLLMPSEALWNKAAALMTSPLASLMGITPFTSASEPSALMIVYAVIYLLVTLGIAIRVFTKRDL